MAQAIAAIEARSVELFRAYFQLSDAQQEAATVEYTTVLQPALLAHYGPDALATVVDPWAADTYSDLYKDRNGFRPRGHSYATMKAFMDNIPPLEDDADEPHDGEEDDRQAELAQMIDAYYSFDDQTEADLRDFEEVYGVSGRLFAASALRGIGEAAHEI